MKGIIIGGFLLCIVSLVELVIIDDAMDGEIDSSIFNPVSNYRRWASMNWFGVVLFTLLLNIICPGLAIGYWFYKLCTVGRKG